MPLSGLLSFKSGKYKEKDGTKFYTAFWTCRPTWNRATPIPRPPTMSILPWTHDMSFGKHPYDKKKSYRKHKAKHSL